MPQVSVAEQSSRNDDRLAILSNELANEQDEKNRALIQQEINSTSKANTSGKPFTVMAGGDSKSANSATYDFFSSGVIPVTKKTTTNKIETKSVESTESANSSVVDFFESGKIPNVQQSAVEEVRKSSSPQQVKQDLLHTYASGLGHSVLGGIAGLKKLATGGSAEEAAREVESMTSAAFQSENPEVRAAVESHKNPLNWPGLLAKKAGEVEFEKAQREGRSPEASAAMGAGTETLLNAAAFGLGGRAIKGKSEIATKPDVSTTAETAKPNLDVPTVLRQQFEARRAAQEGKKAESPEQPLPKAEEPTFSESAVSVAEPGKKLPLPEQARRSEILERIGLPREKQRNSAVEGDPLTAKGDFDQTKMVQEPAGIAAKIHFDAERAALENHANQIIKETGGSVPKEIGIMDSDLLHSRGNNIASPFDNLKSILDEKTKQLYSAKDAEAGGAPSVNLNKFKELIEKDSAFEGKAPNQSLRGGIRAYLREQNILNKDGSFNPITAKEAEGIRQYINSQYSYETSGLAGKIKNAIDNDVFENVGKDIYHSARQLHALKKATLDNPTGISKLMDYDPNTPINRSVSFEKIPDFVSRLPNDQFSHIVKVLKEMPEELQPQAQAALAEIKAHMVNKIAVTGAKFKGQWNEKGVSKELADNQSKFKLVFSPEELNKLADLNEAGKILKVDPSYLGAAPQAAGLLKRGMIAGLPSGSATVGATIGSLFGPLGSGAGAATGAAIGSKLAQSIGEKAALKSWNERIGTASTKLKDIKP